MKPTAENGVAARILVLAVPAAVLALGALFVWLVLPGLTFPPCPFLAVGHFYCPGCGATRSLAALLRGDILQSLKQNLAVVVLLIICMLFYIELVARAFGKKIKIPLIHSKAFMFTLLGIWAVYVVARNFIPSIAPV